ncbi:hypothetical protein [Serratia proteamaculans]|uniref:hypothetical protein n=1 Tax=Serratia proteamaculans TaxID=28151 RepID=UPI003CFEB067
MSWSSNRHLASQQQIHRNSSKKFILKVFPISIALADELAWSFATAGFIGVLGVEQARQLGKRWAERKADEI